MTDGLDAGGRSRVADAKDVSVIIPVAREHVDVLKRAVESAKEAGGLSVHYDGVDFYDTKENYPSGVCGTRNRAIHETYTSLILPLDADDTLLPGAVERMAAAWSPGKVVYGGWREQTFQSETATADDRMTIYHNEDKQANPPEMLTRKHLCHATYLFAKEDWQRVGGYDPDFSIGAEDHAFMIALAASGCELVRLDGDPLYVKTMNENGRTHKAIRHKDMIRQLLLEKYPDFMTRS